MNRVVVTGIGVVSALGNNAAEFWESISSGRSGIGPLTNIDASELRIKNVAEARNFDAAEYFDEKELMFLDPFAQFGIVAAREAVADSGIVFKDGIQDSAGGVTGSCLGGKETEGKL